MDAKYPSIRERQREGEENRLEKHFNNSPVGYRLPTSGNCVSGRQMFHNPHARTHTHAHDDVYGNGMKLETEVCFATKKQRERERHFLFVFCWRDSDGGGGTWSCCASNEWTNDFQFISSLAIQLMIVSQQQKYYSGTRFRSLDVTHLPFVMQCIRHYYTLRCTHCSVPRFSSALGHRPSLLCLLLLLLLLLSPFHCWC